VAYGSESHAAEGFKDRASAKTKVRCPKCGSDTARRVERKGFLQRRILPLFGYFPWTCSTCKESFTMRKRYRKKSRRKEYVE
jgi:DNA-directed RNA polymerase subunit RPC12/RpoP